MTKKVLFCSVIALCSVALAGCSSDDDYLGNMPSGGGGGGMGGMGSGSSLMTFETLSDFTVELNTTALDEQDVVPTSTADATYNHYVENNFSEKNAVNVVFSDGSATVTGLASGDVANVDGAYVEIVSATSGNTYNVSGSTTAGQLRIVSDKKFKLALNGVSINNPDGAAINIQDGNCFVVLTGDNVLSDGSSASYSTSNDEDMKAVFFSEDDLRLSGNGTLTINANNSKGKAALQSDDQIFIRPGVNLAITSGSSAGNGIKTNEALTVKGGVINITTAATGAKGLSSDADMTIDGGRITAITTGGVDTSDPSDPSGSAGIKCDSTLTVNGGELWLKSTGTGGKGISVDYDLVFNGGTTYVITSGSKYGSSNSVSPKGIRCDKNITINGGDIYVRTSGSNAEGIESKATLTFNGGRTAAQAYDDGFNASTSITMNGGYALAISTGSSDGMDSNGNIKVTGGVLMGVASNSNSEDGLDCESGISLTGGVAMGFSTGGMGGRISSGRYLYTTVSGSAGSYCALLSGSTPQYVFALPRTYSSGKLLLVTSLASGSYTLGTGVTPTGGTKWMNYYDGATSVSGGSSTSVTLR